MLRVDHRPFKKAMHELIERTALQKDWYEPFSENVKDLIREHRISLTDEYALQVSKLLMAHNKQRAHKLVDCLGDSGWTWAGAWMMVILKLLAKLAVLVLFVVLVVFVYDSCRG